MAGNERLTKAKATKDNEFYTQYEDIEKEMNEYVEYNKDVFRDKTILLPCDDPEWSNFTKYFVANFNRFGLKKLISTSYAQDKKPYKKPLQLSMFEVDSPDYDETKTNSHGKIFTLTRKNRNVNKDDLKWKYLEGDPKRQEVLATALDWVSDHDIAGYMAQHRQDNNIDGLKNHFETVIDWINSIFDYTDKEVRGLPWGDYYKKYSNNAYSKSEMNEKVDKLMSDPFVNNKRGIFEYLLSGETEKQLLDIRIFEDSVKRSKYQQQTSEAKKHNKSNCPLCASGDNANKTKIWKYDEMDADHVSAWSKGGSTDISNCEMLCKTHNRAKGNR